MVRSPESLYPFLLDSDLAVCAGGQTTYQAAATGTPPLALVVADNQVENVRALVRSQMADTAHLSGADADSQAIRTALNELIAPSGLRQHLSENGQRLVDGQGAIRVARRIGYLTQRMQRG
jgi:UDP-2,4-diacetamido-2,4,6-trideoxy-beta-L-altropyranose hydrolase